MTHNHHDNTDDPSPNRCTAKARRSGKQCRLRAMRGTNVCQKHGGAAPQVKRAAKQRLAVHAAKREVARLGGRLDANPLDVLLEWVREAASNVAAYRLVIRQLEIPVPATGDVTAPADTDRVSSVLVNLYNDERDRAAKYAKMAVDAGVEERLVRIQESQAAAAWNAVTGALEKLDLSRADRELFGREFARLLRNDVRE